MLEGQHYSITFFVYFAGNESLQFPVRELSPLITFKLNDGLPRNLVRPQELHLPSEIFNSLVSITATWRTRGKRQK